MQQIHAGVAAQAAGVVMVSVNREDRQGHVHVGVLTRIYMYLVGRYRYLYPGLRIRSIFGRILIQQIRILKSDPDPGSYWY